MSGQNTMSEVAEMKATEIFMRHGIDRFVGSANHAVVVTALTLAYIEGLLDARRATFLEAQVPRGTA